MSVRFWEPGKEFKRIEAEMMSTMREVLINGDLIMRQQMLDFEKHLAEFVGTSDAVGVSNCTDGLQLLLEAVGIGPGDEVITVSHTFMATMSSIHHAGATPVLVDVGDDHNMDVEKVEAAITPRTKAIMPVHLNGRLVVMDRLMEIAKKHDLLVLEDTAQALGGAYMGVRGGAWGLAGVFSFYPAKLLGAYGDAGAIVTSDSALAERLRELRDHGRISKTGFSGWGWNSRLDNLQAAVLDLKLTKVPGWINQRRRLAAIYDEELAAVPQVKRPPEPDGGPFFDIYQNYVIEAGDRDKLHDHLASRGIETLISPGPVPNHKQPVGLDHFKLPKTEALCARVLSLPLNNELEEDQVLEVAGAIKDFYS
ncbi:MAG TPA: DegT/DnrJ/EryC1/StrS family aminotransferase [Candidatus Dormibacteraeota bacterium]|nr:DegT/DnrJ/EryC1/StrS family aminotransferase [Candidatus Dormibacteraeota bacterium]